MEKKKEFLLGIGCPWATFQHINENEFQQYIVDMLSTEGIQSSKIEAAILDRKSLQSSITLLVKS